jgi:uncharacterized metal-binding protein
MASADEASNRKDVIVYACAGASNLGQLANEIAIRLDRMGLAELCCLTEVAAKDASVAAAEDEPRRPLLAIDGCTNGCCSALLAQRGMEATRTVLLAGRGVAKAKHVLVDEAESERVFGQVLAELAPLLGERD